MVDQLLQNLVQCSRERTASLKAGLSTGLESNELHFDRACTQTLDIRRQQLMRQRARLEQERLVQLQALFKARQEREILEMLQVKALNHYRIEVAKSEQRAADDLFLLRRAYLSSR